MAKYEDAPAWLIKALTLSKRDRKRAVKLARKIKALKVSKDGSKITVSGDK